MGRIKFLPASFFILGNALASAGYAQQPNFNTNLTSITPASPASPDPSSAAPTPDNGVTTILREALQLMSAGKLDDALNKVNEAIQTAPNDPDSYGVRGTIYSQKKQWDLAVKDFQKVSEIDPKNMPAKFNIAEVNFRQKLYDQARPGFVALELDPELGDLATYKVFLCDLFGGHEDMAQRELDAFNKVGSNASYYFANAAWFLYHKQTEDARSWVVSATNIYASQKVGLFSASLFDLGYLPLPPPPN